MYKYIFCFFAMLSCSCETKSNDELRLFNGLSFHLENDETILPIDESVQSTFETLTNNTTKIPLYRFIESDNYSIFIGLPYLSSLSALDAGGGDPKNSLTILPGKDTVYYKRYNRDSLIISEYAARFKGNLIYLAGISTSQSISNALFDRLSLSERIGS